MHVVLLSPHRDDAAFSCGLLLQELQAAVTVVNVCTVSDYAPYLAAVDGTDRTAQITEARRVEDECFATMVLANEATSLLDLRMVDLRWQDAPLRWSIADEQVLADPVLPAAEITTLADRLAEFTDADLALVPLAVGGHVDHRLVRDAAVRAFSADAIVFYEDLPYACRVAADDLHAATSTLLPWKCKPWTTDMRGRRGDKQRMALCYPSQIAAEVAFEMEQYAAAQKWKENFFGTPGALTKLRGALVVRDDALCL